MAEGTSLESRAGEAVDRVRPPDDVDPSELLELLSDAGCRAIIAATGRPRTAAELCEVCDMPTSTVYRKLEALSDAAVLDETRRLQDHGNHPVQYRRRMDGVSLSFDDGTGVDVRIDPGPARD